MLFTEISFKSRTFCMLLVERGIKFKKRFFFFLSLSQRFILDNIHTHIRTQKKKFSFKKCLKNEVYISPFQFHIQQIRGLMDINVLLRFTQILLFFHLNKRNNLFLCWFKLHNDINIFLKIRNRQEIKFLAM